MKPARIIVLVIALAAGGVAAMLASRSRTPVAPPPVAQMKTVQVLVAADDIPVGNSVTNKDLRWQTWPADAANASFIRKSARPDAISQLAKSIARQPFSAGEPIRESKLIKADGSGYMAAILPSGMRAVSIRITPETGAGGFILPNDHVDVILSRRDREVEKATGVESQVSETILGNVRVLAIDQTVEEKNGQRVVVGKTATLELAPSQTELITRAEKMGTLTLALRSIADANKNDEKIADDDGNRRGVSVVRFGVPTVATSR